MLIWTSVNLFEVNILAKIKPNLKVNYCAYHKSFYSCLTDYNRSQSFYYLIFIDKQCCKYVTFCNYLFEDLIWQATQALFQYFLMIILIKFHLFAKKEIVFLFEVLITEALVQFGLSYTVLITLAIIDSPKLKSFGVVSKAFVLIDWLFGFVRVFAVRFLHIYANYVDFVQTTQCYLSPNFL